jgi:hypothetical protein
LTATNGASRRALLARAGLAAHQHRGGCRRRRGDRIAQAIHRIARAGQLVIGRLRSPGGAQVRQQHYAAVEIDHRAARQRAGIERRVTGEREAIDRDLAGGVGPRDHQALAARHQAQQRPARQVAVAQRAARPRPRRAELGLDARHRHRPVDRRDIADSRWVRVPKHGQRRAAHVPGPRRDRRTSPGRSIVDRPRHPASIPVHRAAGSRIKQGCAGSSSCSPSCFRPLRAASPMTPGRAVSDRKRGFEPRPIQLAWDVLDAGGWLRARSAAARTLP